MDQVEYRQLKVQVMSYAGRLTLVREGRCIFAIRGGRCEVCGCSAFRHNLFLPYPVVNCKHECPTNVMRAYNSEDLVSLTMPQFCDPALAIGVQRRISGPVTLELREEGMGEIFSLEAPAVSYPRLEGGVTKAAMLVLYEMQDRRCNGCFRTIPMPLLTYDHRLAKSKAGQRDMANAELMCRRCNEAKADGDMFKFLYFRWQRYLPNRLSGFL